MTVKFSDTIGGGSSVNPADNFAVKIVANDPNSTPADAPAFAVTDLQNDSNAVPVETSSVNVKGLSDSNAGQSEGRTVIVRSWATGCSSNDTNLANPANANGANDGTFCAVKTNNSVGDLTNPVTLNTGSMNFPGGTPTSAQIRIWFKVPARTTALDTITITATSSGGFSSTLYTHSGTALVDHSSGNFTVDVSSLTTTQLSNLVLHANYQASIVASPETSLQIDAWAIDATETI